MWALQNSYRTIYYLCFKYKVRETEIRIQSSLEHLIDCEFRWKFVKFSYIKASWISILTAAGLKN